MRKIKREFDTTSAKFVFTKNELGYQEVLDDMGAAEEIMTHCITHAIEDGDSSAVEEFKDAIARYL